MLDPDPRVRPAAAQVFRALDEQRFTWRPGRRHLRAAAVVLGSVAAAAVLVAVASSWVASRGDPARDDIANTLLVTAESTDNGTVYTILDGYRRRLRTMTSGTELNDKNANFFRNRHFALADLNGDRRTDVVFAISDPSVEHQLEIYHRRPDGGLELVDAWNLHLEMDYDGRTFGTFMPRDVVCGDLDGDGRPEIVVVQISSPYYPGTVRVFDATGHELLRVLHPGLPANVLIGDRDRDGRSELYVGATNNFVADTPGRESLPVFFAVDVDWERSGQIVSLFGPGRRLPDRVPKGVRLIYALFDRQRLVEPSSPWRFASVRRISPESADHFLEVIANRVEVAGAQKVMNLRSFYLDRRLRMTDALWVSATLDRLGLDIGAEDFPDQLGITYWNGSTWQPEVCPVPQSE
jgi:hypothetical protein